MDELDSMLADLDSKSSTPSSGARPAGPVSSPGNAGAAHSMNTVSYTPAQGSSGPGAAYSMNSVTMTPANGSYSSGPGAAHSMNSVTMTPANGSYSSGPGAAHSMNSVSMTPANASSSSPGGARSMNSVTMTPANAASPYAAGGGQSVTMTPANSYSGPGAAHSMNSVTMTPANASYSGPGASYSGPGGGAQSMNSVTMTPANGAYSGPGGGAHSMNSVTMTPANASSPYAAGSGQSVTMTPANAYSGPGAAPRTMNLTPANASAGPGPASFSGPGPAMSGPGPAFSGPGPSFSGPGPAMMSGPGPSFSGPGPAMMSGPGPSFSGPGPAAAAASGGSNFSSGPGAAWAQKNADKRDEPIQLANKTPDGRDIIHKGPPCANCGEMIIGQCTNALGKTYHPEHFVCACCSQPFVGGKFMIKDEEPYCETDFYELFGNKCKTCGDPIRDKYIAASEKLYFHPEHFVCETCGTKLVGKKFKVQELSQEVLCIDCHVKRITVIGGDEKICGKCLQPIQGEFVILKGQYVHAEHFRCEECGCAFVGGNCHEFEGALYCTEHYEKLLKKTCSRCRKPILGRGVSAVGRMWHPEHFCCFTCGDVLNGASFFEKDGEAYCETHYAALFASVCDYCHKPILADGRTFIDKHYHAEHFKCSVCDNLLKTGHIREWDQKPYCDKCYMKLPSEVRKKYEKKKNNEMKIEKKHEVEEKKAAAKEEKVKEKEAKAAAKAAAKAEKQGKA